MLLFDAPLTFREFMTNEELPLATVFRDVLTFLRGRTDVVLFGAQAVNAYCEPSRMTEHLDVLSTRGAELAQELAAHLGTSLHIAVRVREVAQERGLRLYQLRKPKNRHLIDVRQVSPLPEHRIIDGVPVAAPAELAAMKAISIAARRGRPKELTDRADLARLVQAFPDLAANPELVAGRIAGHGGGAAAVEIWRDAAEHPLEPDDDDAY